jgi:hypothetical protein
MFLYLWHRLLNALSLSSRRGDCLSLVRKSSSFRPQLEAFEDRTLLSQVWWVGGSGPWSDPNHWLDLGNLGHQHVPNASDDVWIASTGANVVVTHSNGSDAVQSIIIANGNTLALTGGSLSVAGAIAVADNPGTYSLAGGTLANATVASGTTITGTSSGGTLDGVTLAGTLDLASNNNAFASLVNTTRLAGGTILGGAANGTLTGTPSGGTLDGVTLDTLDLATNDGAHVNVLHGLTVNGSVQIGAGDGSTAGTLSFTNTQTLSGSGIIIVGGNPSNDLQINTSSTTVTIGSSLTVHGKSGQFAASSPASDAWINQGTVAADVAGGTFTLAGTWTNNGVLQALNGDALFLQNAFSNAGSVTIGSGSTFTAGGNYTQTGGTTTLNGGTLAANSLVAIQGGILSGTGTINADVQNAGLVTIGDSTAVGILTINGNFIQTPAGTLAVKVGGFSIPGTDFDQLVLTPGHQATIDGTLQVTLINGYIPTTGDTVMIMTFDAETGNFATLTGDGPLFTDTYDPTDVSLVAN